MLSLLSTAVIAYLAMESVHLTEKITCLHELQQEQEQHLCVMMQACAESQNLLQYVMQQVESKDLENAIRQWSDQHRQQFHSMAPPEVGNLFGFAQHLHETCRKWLLAEDREPERIVERVAMNQFVSRLPEETAKWVRHHQPATLNEAVHLATTHLASLCSSSSSV